MSAYGTSDSHTCSPGTHAVNEGLGKGISEPPNTGTKEKLSKRNYFIFGYNISHSLSPTLHNAGFQALGLPYHYSIHQTSSVDDTVESIIKRTDFGGGSVTFPHKLQIGRLMDSITPRAEKIGAVNTIVVQEAGATRKLQGDNTDWMGIKKCIERSNLSDLKSSAALVLGAGGAARAACYAIQLLDVAKLIVVNRTVSRGKEMTAHFPKLRSHVFETFEEALLAATAPIRIIVACVPADDLGEEKIPAELFSSSDSGVLVEMAYRPQVTGMMKASAQHPKWKVYKGIDVLEEQAYEQFQMWTGRDAPVTVMREAMQAKIKANM